MVHMHSHTSGGAATAAAALKTTGPCEGCQVGMGESYPQIWVVGDAQHISKSYRIKIRTKMIIYPSNISMGSGAKHDQHVQTVSVGREKITAGIYRATFQKVVE